jgi:hypothetical protein
VLSPEGAWALLLALAGRRRAGAAEGLPLACTLGPDGALRMTSADDGTAQVTWSDRGLACAPGQPGPVRDLIELYAPLFPGGAAPSWSPIWARASMGRSPPRRVTPAS